MFSKKPQFNFFLLYSQYFPQSFVVHQIQHPAVQCLSLMAFSVFFVSTSRTDGYNYNTFPCICWFERSIVFNFASINDKRASIFCISSLKTFNYVPIFINSLVINTFSYSSEVSAISGVSCFLVFSVGIFFYDYTISPLWSHSIIISLNPNTSYIPCYNMPV